MCSTICLSSCVHKYFLSLYTTTGESNYTLHTTTGHRIPQNMGIDNTTDVLYIVVNIT